MTVVISLVAGILFYYLINGLIKLIFGRKLIIQNRLEELQGTHTWDKSAVIDRPFGERLFGPTLKKIINFFALLIPMNENTYEKLNTQLIQAGISMEARQYRATVLLFITLCASGLMFYGFISDSPTERIILLTIIGIYAGFTISRFYLKSKITGRQRKNISSIPKCYGFVKCVCYGRFGIRPGYFLYYKPHGGLSYRRVEDSVEGNIHGYTEERSLGQVCKTL